MTNEMLFVKLAIALLDDDDGISETAYAALLDMGQNIRPELCLHLNNTVLAPDGRFYLPDDWMDRLPKLWSNLPRT